MEASYYWLKYRDDQIEGLIFLCITSTFFPTDLDLVYHHYLQHRKLMCCHAQKVRVHNGEGNWLLLYVISLI